ncbi:MAG: carbamoyltransferase HypF [Syntrophomonadaceae bacterium]|nr:carbamoyltransferase HypF [Syntrophomonadaceae bacterium]
MLVAYHIRITGIVQGVGFRPHVFRLASEYGLKGWVLNSSAGVFIEAEGSKKDLDDFARRLVEEPPPLAIIRQCEISEKPLQGFLDFTIRNSEDDDSREVMISPDIAICADCKREVRDRKDRRYGYAFTNCTNCGPRYTIIKDIPYDRIKTTMAPFPMCPECQEEYEDPLHRRFHAQPNACPVCGPHTTLVDASGKEVGGEAVDYLKKGYIIAVKGLGGFHLACDATNIDAVKNLRQRKRRDAKPFAVMVRDLQIAEQYAYIDEIEARWLESPQAPIVILKSRQNPALPTDVIHPGLETLGIMLPYTPLHYLLFDEDIDILIMTSANISDEPLIFDNDAALEKLSDIADYFLVHNREIYNPCDDSVISVRGEGFPHYFRRARRFVPLGINITPGTQPVLALGGEMKNTFCITRSDQAYISPHWGDLNHYLNYRNYLSGIERFKQMLNTDPQIIAHDLHPDYQTTRLAQSMKSVKTIGVQHHFAHMAAVMAENEIQGQTLGLICDGTGWGLDGAIWGCEILVGDYREINRLGHLRYMPMPGGDLNSRKPYRMALIYLYQAWGAEKAAELARKYLPDLSEEECSLLLGQLEHPRGEIMTSSAGRLFEAVSAFLGICAINRYEGQAAIELEARADMSSDGAYPYKIEWEQDELIMDVLPLWQEITDDMEKGIPVSIISERFHRTAAKMFAAVLNLAREKTRLNEVVISGGVFHNEILTNQLVKLLEVYGFTVYQQHNIPPGDGGISLGQAIIASEVSK